MYPLMCGLMSALCFVAAVLFLRAYRRTRDRLFAIFAIAFPILGLSQLYLGIFNQPEVDYPPAYIPRLLTFALILIAIVDKNRGVRRRTLRLVQRSQETAAQRQERQRDAV